VTAPRDHSKAVGAARKWTFVPARRGSRAVESVVEVPVKFALSRH